MARLTLRRMFGGQLPPRIAESTIVILSCVFFKIIKPNHNKTPDKSTIEHGCGVGLLLAKIRKETPTKAQPCSMFFFPVFE